MIVSNNATTVVSTKGQVILPKIIRDKLQWHAGTRLTVEDITGGVVLKVAPVFAPTRPEDVFGSLASSGPAKTLEQMEASIGDHVKQRHAVGRY